jgi:hypothetical protein
MVQLVITPKTKIYDLLEAFPQLEEILIAKAPEFKRLKNPLLRNTIARVTTIAQAATISGLAVDALVNDLRAQVGQDKTGLVSGSGITECSGTSVDGTSANSSDSETSVSYTTEPPTWFNPGDIQATFDVGILLNQGEHPVHEVLTRLKKLDDDEILDVEAPFIPAPLIDKAISLGYAHWLKLEAGGSCHIYFKRIPKNAGEEPPVFDAS